MNDSVVVDAFKRRQPQLNMCNVYPPIDGECACGCGRELAKRKKKWYSNECRDEAYAKLAVISGNNWIVRNELLLRDGGGCRNCGLISDDWEADHIIPVFKGGGGCDLSNYQTLCKDCHKGKTKKDLTCTVNRAGKNLAS